MSKTELEQISSATRLIGQRMVDYAPTRQLMSQLDGPDKTFSAVCGLSGSSFAFVLRTILQTTDRPALVVCRRVEEARDYYDDLRFLIGEEHVSFMPARQILPYDFRAPVGEIMGRRISTLADLQNGKTKVVVCPVRALIEPVMPPTELSLHSLSISVGEEIELDRLVERLIVLGFRRVPLVEEVGDFAVRGGLIDFFTPGSERPVRIELFGDEVESMRTFETSSQRTIERINSVSILPRRETTVTINSIEKHLERLPVNDADLIRNRYVSDPELPGLEWLSVLFGLPQGCLMDYLADNTIIWSDGEEGLKDEIDAILDEGRGLYERIKGRFEKLLQPEEYYFACEKIFERIQGYDRVEHLPFKSRRSDQIDFACQSHPALNARLDLLGTTIREFEDESISYFITTDSESQRQRLGELIADKSGLDSLPLIEVADLKGGFVCRAASVAVLTDHEIFGRFHRRIRRKRFKEGVAIADYSSLNIGDFVVHTEYGVARYLGLKTLTVDNRPRDCLLLQYQGTDRLYVPIEEFNRVSRYSGKDSAPTLTGLGGNAWEKLKARTKKAVVEMAEELLRLYAQRKAVGGYAFGEDTVWLRQLEASFVFEETRDQMKAIIDVKRDMSEAAPMDRLICGDVGYGKTEVAVRAAFKAIDKGKQVALLVPTTILAQQHYQTFSERLADFPVRIEMLSRFRTRAQQTAIIDDLAEGKVDLVIGTHRLFSKDIAFADLGLLIIDEEHRFGVRHKEKLRELRHNVDTLSMTATPIPRTLQMSLMGVRDMSLINTSPKDRLPIITEIIEFDRSIIATTILREIDRGGQVFFVHNRVQSIDSMYGYLKKLLPKVEIAVAHGQMHPRTLEGVMLGFMTKRFDVLLCTSIIESGLDIPSANTIIMNRADRFGLAQLYQMRGRVGRSSRQAYAYLIAPPANILKSDAIKRLRAIEAHSDLGSGFALAMRDLDIRGAGTVLGARQSGFIEQIGYDLYNKLLEEAVAELKGQAIQKLPDTRLEMDIEIRLPDKYINDRQHKVDIYRRIADCRHLDDVEKLRDEIADRFGTMPQSAVNLFDAAAVKVSASMMDIEKVTMREGHVNLIFKEDRPITRAEVEGFRKATDQPLEFSLTGRSQVILDLSATESKDQLSYLRGVLAKL